MADIRYAIVQPILEPDPSWYRKVGPVMAFVYFRWSSWSIGVEVLSAGFALAIGPAMIGACHIRRQLGAFDAEAQRLVSASPILEQETER